MEWTMDGECVKKVVIWGLLNTIVVKFILEATLDSSQVAYGFSNEIFKDVMSLLRNGELD